MEALLAADAGTLAYTRAFAQIAGYSVVSSERRVWFSCILTFVNSC